MRTGRSQSERKSKSHLEHATSAFVFSCNVALHVTKLICGVDVEAVVGLGAKIGSAELAEHLRCMLECIAQIALIK
jgi:hypothetical protein